MKLCYAIEFGCLIHWDIAGLCAFEDLVDLVGGVTE
jgi:hypothetical protein